MPVAVFFTVGKQVKQEELWHRRENIRYEYRRSARLGSVIIFMSTRRSILWISKKMVISMCF